MRSLFTLFALLGLFMLAGTVSADEAPAPETPAPYVLPAAIVCVETAGTSHLRPCRPWCARGMVSHVLRLMWSEQGEGEELRAEWQTTYCADYLAEEQET